MKLTKEQKEILSHTIKNGFYCGEESKELDELCAEGLMYRAGRKSFVPDTYFGITRIGRETIK